MFLDSQDLFSQNLWRYGMALAARERTEFFALDVSVNVTKWRDEPVGCESFPVNLDFRHMASHARGTSPLILALPEKFNFGMLALDKGLADDGVNPILHVAELLTIVSIQVPYLPPTEDEPNLFVGTGSANILHMALGAQENLLLLLVGFGETFAFFSAQ